MTDTAIDPKLISRIQKMLALSRDDGATEGEAQNAADIAARLMRENNLSMASIEAAGGQAEGGKRTKQEAKGRAQYEFQQQLMLACAEVNFCVVLKQYTSKYDKWGDYKGSRTSGYKLIGREANVIATQQMFDYLMSTTERLAFEFVGSDNKMRLSRAAVSFKEGCAERLGKRLRDRHAAALAEQARAARASNAAPASGGGTALVVVLEDFAQAEADRNEDFRLNRPEGTTAARRLQRDRRSEMEAVGASALKAYEATPDRDILSSVAQSAIGAHLSNLGQAVDEEVEKLVAAAVRNVVTNHVHRLEEAQKLAKETPKQKAAREEREARENERFWRRWSNQQEAKANSRNWSAYSAGSAAGDTVGLDKQVDKAAPAPKLK